MQKKKIFKKWHLIILVPIISFVLFYLWIEYQQSTREVIDVDDISNIKVLLDKNSDPSKATIEGKINLKKFERISTISAELKEGIIYIYLTKTKGLSDQSNFSQSLSKILVSHDSNAVNKIAFVSGENIIVINKKDHTQSYIDVSNYDNIKVIWNN